jgi:hypothetical protein
VRLEIICALVILFNSVSVFNMLETPKITK